MGSFKEKMALGDQMEMTGEYAAFVEKFKPKKTTDECYTPDNVYAAVHDWAVKEYGLEGGADYTPVLPRRGLQERRLQRELCGDRQPALFDFGRDLPLV